MRAERVKRDGKAQFWRPPCHGKRVFDAIRVFLAPFLHSSLVLGCRFSFLSSHSSYLNGIDFVGRPTNEELRHDLRAIMETRSDYRYEAYDTPEVRQIRIPQQEWAGGAPLLGASGLPVARGVVRWFDLNAGIGMIAREGSGDDVFFHFTALPGQGYRTIRPATPVKFEIVEGKTGPTARNVQEI